MAAATPPTIDWGDVQGTVLRGYGKHPYSATLLLKVDDAEKARAWIAAALDRITTADRAVARADDVYLNVAFARGGLASLGFTEDVFATFPTAFLEGMASPNRSRILGDDDPSKWDWGGPGKDVDVMVLIFARSPDGLASAVAAEQAAVTGFSPVVPPILTPLWPDEKEHFGFHDGISQPIIEGSPGPAPTPRRPRRPSRPTASRTSSRPASSCWATSTSTTCCPIPWTCPARGTPAACCRPSRSRTRARRPTSGVTARTWLPARSRSTSRSSGTSSPGRRKARRRSDPKAAQDWLGAKLIGRWPGGRADAALSPERDDPSLAEANDFVYDTVDPDGLGCPFGAHTRRGNPRDTLGDDPTEALNLTKRHRLIRRGRSYGPRADDRLG